MRPEIKVLPIIVTSSESFHLKGFINLRFQQWKSWFWLTESRSKSRESQTLAFSRRRLFSGVELGGRANSLEQSAVFIVGGLVRRGGGQCVLMHGSQSGVYLRHSEICFSVIFVFCWSSRASAVWRCSPFLGRFSLVFSVSVVCYKGEEFMAALEDLKKQVFYLKLGAESPYRQKVRRVHHDSEKSFFSRLQSLALNFYAWVQKRINI